jgi:virginiamycin B lyase
MKPHAIVATLTLAALALSPPVRAAAPDPALASVQRPISDLRSTARLHLGKTADWVAITKDALWVGSTGPDAVYEISPRLNRVVATVPLAGQPGAGLAVGFGALWVPLCGAHPALARVDLATHAVRMLPIAPAGPEGGITTSGDSVWMATDQAGTLARINPASGRVRQTVHLAAGSYNPRYSGGVVWVTSIEAGLITAVDAHSGAVLGTTSTGPKPRFLTTGGGAVWTLNQGDGTLSRIDARGRTAGPGIALGTPGHGGDIAYGRGMVWTTMSGAPLTATDAKTQRVLRQWIGPGGDSLGIGFGSIWLTDYDRGDVLRIPLTTTVNQTRPAPSGR